MIVNRMTVNYSDGTAERVPWDGRPLDYCDPCGSKPPRVVLVDGEMVCLDCVDMHRARIGAHANPAPAPAAR